jgi:hypothetical protein
MDFSRDLVLDPDILLRVLVVGKTLGAQYEGFQ